MKTTREVFIIMRAGKIDKRDHEIRKTLGKLRKYGLVTERLLFQRFREQYNLEYVFSNSVNHRVRFLRKKEYIYR